MSAKIRIATVGRNMIAGQNICVTMNKKVKELDVTTLPIYAIYVQVLKYSRSSTGGHCSF